MKDKNGGVGDTDDFNNAKTDKAHSKYAASASERWLNCPGSIALCEKAPPSRDNKWSIEGTEAHACLEAFLKNIDNPNAVQKFLSKKYPLDMIEHARHARNLIFTASQKISSDNEILAEQKVKLDHHEDEGGTLDAAIVDEFGPLVVYDYKYGAGIPVEVQNNPQLAFYALALAKKYKYNFTEVVATIIQPRADHPKGPVRSWRMSIRQLKDWDDLFKKGVDRCEKPNARLFAGKWCRYCPAASICPAVGKKSLVTAQVEFEPLSNGKYDLEVPKIKTIAIKNLSQILDASERIEFWIAEVRAHASAVLGRGEKIKGWKLVEKIGRRQYTNPTKTQKEAKAKYGNRAFTTPELLSPAQLEKIKGAKEWVAKRVSNVSSGTTLVSSDDPRPAINQVQEDFGNL